MRRDLGVKAAFAVGLLALCAAVGLATGANSPSSLETVAAVLLSFALVGAAYVRYRVTRDLLDPLAVFLGAIAFYYGLHTLWLEHQGAGFAPFEAAYKDGVPAAFGLVAIGVTSLLLTFGYWKFKPSPPKGDAGRLATTAIVVVFIIGFAFRLYGAKIGAFQRLGSPSASNVLVVTTFAQASLVAFVAAAVQYYRWGRSRFLVLAMGLAHLAFAIVVGRKELVVEIGFAWLASRHYCYRKLRPPVVVAAVALFLFVFTPIIQSGRDPQTLRRLTATEQNQATLTSLPGRVRGYLSDPSQALTGWDIIHERTLGIEDVALTVETTPEVEPFQYGASYIDIPTSLVPRAVWPGKPVHDLGHDFSISYGGRPDDGYSGLTLSPTIAGDFYLNFGVLGVVVGFVILGLILKWLTTWVRDGDPVIGISLYTLLMLKLILVELTVARLGSFLLLNGLLTFGTLYVLRRLTVRAQRRSLRAAAIPS